MILSPAKKLNQHRKPDIETLEPTQPHFLPKAEGLVEQLRQFSTSDLKKLMNVSDKIAALNTERFSDFSVPFNKDNASIAVHLFAGDTYVGLNAEDFTQDDLSFSQKHLGILSGLYGLLRPLDLAQPYRLEMGTKLANSAGKNLYEYWSTSLSERINEFEHKEIINLASKEYFSALHSKVLKAKIITPVFKEKRGDVLKIISFSAKRARGMMARFAVKNRIEQAEGLKSFTEGGYTYSSELSSDVEWLFVR
tara:strand:+ start:55 stop:807 length:753 start_codon:yes stop_codon:yes gene_type:complete